MKLRRSFPWAWLVASLVVIVIVAAIAYWLGATQAGHAVYGWSFHRMFFAGFGFGGPGFWLPVLGLAVIVGILVAALVGPSRPTEAFDDWHRRAHGEIPPGAAGHERTDVPAEDRN